MRRARRWNPRRSRVVEVVTLVAILVGAHGGCGRGERDDGGATRREAAAVPHEARRPEDLEHLLHVFNRGVGWMEQFRHADAVAAFDSVVALAPDWPRGHLDLGIALLHHGLSLEYLNDAPGARRQLERAEDELRTVLRDEPDNPHAHFALGMLYRHRNEAAAARREFEAVLRVDPDDADTHYQLGRLLAREDPARAREHLERALAAVPHHLSALYLLQALRREAGDDAGAGALLQRFQELKAAGAGVTSGMRYGEMGRYGDLPRAFRTQESSAAAALQALPAYRNVAAALGLDGGSGEAVPGWPGRGEAGGREPTLGPGLAAGDLDGDGDLDLVVGACSGVAPARWLRNDGDRFVAVEFPGDPRRVVSASFGDADQDGDLDVFLCNDGADRMLRNDGAGSFTDISAAAGVAGDATRSLSATWADADHDGDLDVFVAAAGRPRLWRNNRDGTFTDLGGFLDTAGAGTRTMAGYFLDADEDLDLDLLVVRDGEPNRLYANDRVGRYHLEERPGLAPLQHGDAGTGVLEADFDGDGHLDVVLLRGDQPPRLWRRVDRVRFEEDTAFARALRNVDAALGGGCGDVDLDGDIDVVLVGAHDAEGFAHAVLLNRGDGRFDPPVRLGTPEPALFARGGVVADLDADGMLEIVVARVDGRIEVWRAAAPPARHWLAVRPLGPGGAAPRALVPPALGLLAEVKTGQRAQVQRLSSARGYLGSVAAPLHFGLGDVARADYVRLLWPDGVLQSELDVAADRVWPVPKIQRRRSSCPLLFTWNGRRFTFVNDFLGVGGLGFFVAPGSYAPPDPTEDVLIPPGDLIARDGVLEVRIAEPMEEITYLDAVQLVAYDHPDSLRLLLDERLGVSPPWPTGRALLVSRQARWTPVAARTDGGQDVHDALARVDRRWPEPPLDPRFIGYAQPHSLEIDFGPGVRSLPPDTPLVLGLHGWVEYPYSHVNYAAWQAGVALHAPSIDVPDPGGGWRPVFEELGYPAGFPRTMTVDGGALELPRHGRLRLRSNMEIYWDQVFVARAHPEIRPRRTVLPPASAELRYLGYPREFSVDGREPPRFDYERRDQGVPFRSLHGAHTPHGDVRALVTVVDDAFALLARGEEIALTFDAAALPALPDGWTRAFVLHADGYCKDMDLYTAFPQTVEPLPYRGMPNYPPPAADRRRVER